MQHRVYHVGYIRADNGAHAVLETLADQLWLDGNDGVITSVSVLDGDDWREATALDIARDQRLLVLNPIK